jgi:hypothetical protein
VDDFLLHQHGKPLQPLDDDDFLLKVPGEGHKRHKSELTNPHAAYCHFAHYLACLQFGYHVRSPSFRTRVREPLIQALLCTDLPCRMERCPRTSPCRSDKTAPTGLAGAWGKWNVPHFLGLVHQAFELLPDSEPWLQLLVDDFNRGRALLVRQAQVPDALETLGGRNLIEGYGHNALQRLPDELQRRAARDLNRGPAKGAYNMRGRCYAEHYTPTDARSECPFSHVEMETLGTFSGYGFWDLELTTEEFERRLVAVDDPHKSSSGESG